MGSPCPAQAVSDGRTKGADEALASMSERRKNRKPARKSLKNLAVMLDGLRRGK
jgi:hypothetical protein